MDEQILYLLDAGKHDDIGGQKLNDKHQYIVNWRNSFVIMYSEYVHEFVSSMKYSFN
jgi:hypothetical protein